MKKLEEYVLTIPDFPEPGIMFRDITSVIQDPDGLKLAIDGLTDAAKDLDFDLVIGPESRGFIFGVPVAYLLGKGFVPIRKKGKLPRETVSRKYDLEYGQAEVEMHKDAIRPGQKVIIVDDLIATGGSAEAAAKLVEDQTFLTGVDDGAAQELFVFLDQLLFVRKLLKDFESFVIDGFCREVVLHSARHGNSVLGDALCSVFAGHCLNDIDAAFQCHELVVDSERVQIFPGNHVNCPPYSFPF